MILSTGIYALVKDMRDIYRVHDFLLYITRDFEELSISVHKDVSNFYNRACDVLHDIKEHTHAIIKDSRTFIFFLTV